jgi:large subunit ribosomal protein L18
MSQTRKESRERRKKHIRKNLEGTAEKPRIYVFKSNKYFYVGAADDIENKVLSTAHADRNVEAAGKLGKEFGDKLKKLKVEKAVFDRSGYKFHGVVKAVADGIVESGIKI